MAIKSGPFEGTVLTGDDAAWFEHHLRTNESLDAAEAHRRSFVYGNTSLENPDITPDLVNAVAEAQDTRFASTNRVVMTPYPGRPGLVVRPHF